MPVPQEDALAYDEVPRKFPLIPLAVILLAHEAVPHTEAVTGPFTKDAVRAVEAQDEVPQTEAVALPLKKLEVTDQLAVPTSPLADTLLAHDAVPFRLFAHEAVPAKLDAQLAVPLRLVAQEAVPNIEPVCGPFRKLEVKELATVPVIPLDVILAAHDAVPFKLFAQLAVPAKLEAQDAVPQVEPVCGPLTKLALVAEIIVPIIPLEVILDAHDAVPQVEPV